jgi:transposase
VTHRTKFKPPVRRLPARVRAMMKCMDPHDRRGVTVIGVDAHKRSHTLVAVDDAGRKLAEKTVSTTSEGHAEAIVWATERFGSNVKWSIEDVRSVSYHLERDLLAAAPWAVVRCPPKLMARTRSSGREPGKSDPIDALAIARAALQEPDLPVAVHDAASWELRQLVDRREDLVLQRVGVMNRVGWRIHLIDASQPTPTRLEKRVRREALAKYLRTQSGLLAELAREELDDLEYLSRRVDSVTERIVDRVDGLGSSLLSLTGCAHLTAAKLIGEAANVDRFKTESAFAKYSGVAPIPRWSGSTAGRLRASPTGNRQINTALHRIAVTQLSNDCAGRAYYQRRRAEGDSGPDAVRRLKRKLARLVFNRLRADYLRWLANPSSDGPSASAVVDQVPAWVELVELAASLEAERAARGPVDVDHDADA